VTIFDAGRAAQQASSLLDVALTELLFFAEVSESLTYEHGTIFVPTKLLLRVGETRGCRLSLAVSTVSSFVPV
jgi:hypothetical protein